MDRHSLTFMSRASRYDMSTTLSAELQMWLALMSTLLKIAGFRADCVLFSTFGRHGGRLGGAQIRAGQHPDLADGVQAPAYSSSCITIAPDVMLCVRWAVRNVGSACCCAACPLQPCRICASTLPLTAWRQGTFAMPDISAAWRASVCAQPSTFGGN